MCNIDLILLRWLTFIFNISICVTENIHIYAPKSQVQEEKPGSTDNFPQHDIAIVGGGMVGMALACSLGRWLFGWMISATLTVQMHKALTIHVFTLRMLYCWITELC